MARAINIEIMRIKSERRTALLCGLVALALACLICAVPGSQANYVQADQNRHTFVLDTKKKHVDIVRYGAGSDRSFDY